MKKVCGLMQDVKSIAEDMHTELEMQDEQIKAVDSNMSEG